MNAPGKLGFENQGDRPLTPVERELRALRRKVAELQGTTLEEMEAKDFEEWCSRPAPEPTSWVSAAAERIRSQQRQTLEFYGASEESDDDLKVVLLSLPLDGVAHRLFAVLVDAIAGQNSGGVPDGRNIVNAWPQLAPTVRQALAAVVRQYAYKHYLATRTIEAE